MTELLMLLIAVSPDDRADWPPSWEADRQHTICIASIANLKKMRSIRGYEDGRWDVWIAKAEEDCEAWGMLSLMVSWLSDSAMRERLLAYKKLVGDERYLRRYRPPTAKTAYP